MFQTNRTALISGFIAGIVFATLLYTIKFLFPLIVIGIAIYVAVKILSPDFSVDKYVAKLYSWFDRFNR